MRRIVNNIMVCMLLVGFSACNDWLDVSPKTEMKAEDMFSTQAGFRDALIGVYSLMCTSSLYGRNLTYGYLDVLAQYYASPLKNVSGGYQHSFNNAANYKYTEAAEEERILSIWQNYYTAIANINQALEFVDKDLSVFTSPEVHDVYKGELLALRAMLHFDVLRLFASSPVLNDNTGLSTLAIPYVDVYTNVARPQLTVKEVLDKVTGDLSEAKTLMRDKEDFDEDDSTMPMYNRKQRMNYYAVTALLARVYLYGNETGKALEQAKEIIGEAGGAKPTAYALASGEATSTDPMFETELIFMLDVQKLKDLSENYFSEATTSTVLSMSGDGKGNVFNASGLDSEFRSRWLKNLSDGVSFALDKYKDMKYIPLFKLSELYLIAAECAGGSTGMAYLNELRNHRGLATLAESENLDDYIYQEYRREFIGEGQLFFFYKRKGFGMIGAEDNVALANKEEVYNLPIPKSEVEFGNIKN